MRALLLRSYFWISDFFKGSPIRKSYNEISLIQSLPAAKGLRYRVNSLNQLLEYVWDNTEYYKRFKGKYDLVSYPVLNKMDLISNYNSIKVEIDKIPGQIGNVFVQRTSGSTGVPFAIPQDTNKRNRRIAEIKFFGNQLGFKSHEKLIQLRSWNQWQKKNSKQIFKENIVPFDISKMGENELKNLCELINKEKAVSLRGYASTFGNIALLAHKYNYSFPSLKIVVSTSEALEDDVRESVKKYMGCEIASQYANEECGILAQERVPTVSRDNKMYFNWSGYWIEILKLDRDEPVEYGEIGRIVVTDLYNYAFPLIRYDTGDTCVLADPDEYSNGYPVISKLYGRRFDLTYSTKGTPIYPLAYGRILKNFSNIISWQFIQVSKDEYELLLKVRYNDKDGEVKILKYLKEIVGNDAVIKIIYVDDIPTLKSGKRKPVVNKYSNMK